METIIHQPERMLFLMQRGSLFQYGFWRIPSWDIHAVLQDGKKCREHSLLFACALACWRVLLSWFWIAWSHPCLSWGFSEILLLELLFMGMDTGRLLFLTFMQQVFCRVVCVTDLERWTPHKYLWVLFPFTQVVGKVELLCSGQADTWEKVKDLFWTLLSGNPSLGSHPLDWPNGSGTSGMDTGPRLAGLWGGEQLKTLLFFFVCLGCLPSSLWAVLSLSWSDTWITRAQLSGGRRASM